MRFLVKLFLIILVVGLVIATAGFFMGMDIEGLETFFDDNDSYGDQIVLTIDDEMDVLQIDAQTRHINLIVTTESFMTIKYYKHDRDTITFPDNGLGTYNFVQEEKFEFFSFIRFKTASRDRLTIEIEMPETWLFDLEFSTNIGSIRIEHDTVVNYKNLDLNSNTGSIFVKNVAVDSFTGDVDTGAITLIDATVIHDVIAESSTGTIVIENVDADNFGLSTSTGSIQLSNLTGNNIIAAVSTGRITATEINLLDELILSTSTGDITLSDFVADSIRLSTSTGEIKVTVIALNLYNFDLKTSTGKVYVNGDNQGNRHTTSSGNIDLDATASTGDIRIIVQG